MTYDNGESYKGEWKSDVIDGYGEYIWPNGDRYVGNYKRGKRDGSGVMYYQNGDMFTGNWRNGMKDGQGTFTSNSTTKTGNWVRSQYVEQIRSQ
jgi:hypothetical protein